MTIWERINEQIYFKLLFNGTFTKEHFEKINVRYICFHYELDGVEHADDPGQSIPFDEFYKKMAEGAMTKTSQVNAEEYKEYFEGFLRKVTMYCMYACHQEYRVRLTLPI